MLPVPRSPSALAAPPAPLMSPTLSSALSASLGLGAVMTSTIRVAGRVSLIAPRCLTGSLFPPTVP